MKDAARLPPSFNRERHGLAAEVAFARSLTPRQRVDIVALVCRAAIQELSMNARRDALLAQREPLPASTLVVLRRLRGTRVAEHRATTVD